MSGQRRIVETKIVKVIGRRSAFCLHAVLDNHDEVRIWSSETRSKVDDVKDWFDQLLGDTKSYAAAIAMMNIFTIRDHAYRIAESSDHQGEAAYATKSHMRAWAEEIANLCNVTISESGVVEAVTAD